MTDAIGPVEVYKTVQINCAPWFFREDFRKWLDAGTLAPQRGLRGLATWHVAGEPDEYSDVFLLYHQGCDGDGLPEDIWQSITAKMEALQIRYAVVRLVNLPTGHVRSLRVELLEEVLRFVIKQTNSLEQDDHLGADLAYLAMAILDDTFCEWEEPRAIIQLLRGTWDPEVPEKFPNELIWDFIRIVPPETPPPTLKRTTRTRKQKKGH